MGPLAEELNNSLALKKKKRQKACIPKRMSEIGVDYDRDITFRTSHCLSKIYRFHLWEEVRFPRVNRHMYPTARFRDCLLSKRISDGFICWYCTFSLIDHSFFSTTVSKEQLGEKKYKPQLCCGFKLEDQISTSHFCITLNIMHFFYLDNKRY